MNVLWSTKPRPNPHGQRRPVKRLAYGAHIRARVFKVGDAWHMTVVDTRTERVIVRDNTGAWGPMFDLADETVGAVRRSVLQGFGKKALR